MWLARGAVPRDHTIQLQGQLWVTGRDWVDFVSYHPGLPPFIVRVKPEPITMLAFDEHLPKFIAELLAGRERLRELGVEPALESAAA